MTNRTGALALACLLAGCHGKLDPQSGTVLEGFRYGWQLFNHRLSFLEVETGPTADLVGVVGGTSTTNILPELGDTCDPDTCAEIPFGDTSDVEVKWATLSSERTAIASGRVHLEVGRDGASDKVSAKLPDHAPDVGVAILSGIGLSTSHPVAGGMSCYNPAYGWHPRQIAVALGDAKVEDGTVTADVTASFSAGKTFEEMRQCIDLVNADAIVDLEVVVTFLVGKGEATEQDLVQGAVYEFSGDKIHPEEQPDPTPVALDFGFEPTAFGFGAIDFSFDPENTEDRGAYLRTLSFSAAPKTTGVEANATATNFSPGTQITDFAYRFEGVVRAVDFELEVKRGTSTTSLPAALDADGNPVVTTLDH